jgi:hypothetical protein
VVGFFAGNAQKCARKLKLEEAVKIIVSGRKKNHFAAASEGFTVHFTKFNIN